MIPAILSQMFAYSLDTIPVAAFVLLAWAKKSGEISLASHMLFRLEYQVFYGNESSSTLRISSIFCTVLGHVEVTRL
jgi:hypothetical protein